MTLISPCLEQFENEGQGRLRRACDSTEGEKYVRCDQGSRIAAEVGNDLCGDLRPFASGRPEGEAEGAQEAVPPLGPHGPSGLCERSRANRKCDLPGTQRDACACRRSADGGDIRFVVRVRKAFGRYRTYVEYLEG